MHLFFLKFLFISFCIVNFIENQLHLYNEIKPESNWHSYEVSMSENDYFGQQDK